MSQETQEEKLRLDPLEEVVLEKDDVKNVREFYDHFKIPVIPALREALDAFEKDQTPATQDALRIALCKSSVETDHELIKDNLWKVVRDNSDAIVFHNRFDEQVQETLDVNQGNK